MSLLWFEPKIILAIWGTTNPKKPITPTIAVETDAKIIAISANINLSLFTLTPKDFAVWSSN